MRFNGHNVLAIVVAALVIYLIEYVIFAVLIPGDQYMAMVGITAEQADPSRMPFGAIPPILAAIGLSLAVKWRNAAGLMGGVTTGLLMGFFFAFAVSLYGFVYGANTAQYIPVELAHYLVCYAAAGAVLGAWK